ncbi:MAG: DNA mismatch repair endonuclease MutL [Chloroflexota bacterium]
MPIHILPPEVASQIAAGEVVERPASVVKELVENALDAGAHAITVSVEAAGQKLIEVSDDGSGIPPTELPLAVERHATSKLNQAQDLFSLATLGFRGEALASIGSVARMTVTARTAGEAAGARLRVEGGLVYPLEAAGAPVGTLVRVEDLFYNVPARLKFLKSDATERRAIDNLVTRYALAYPGVRFKLVQDGRPVIQTSGRGDRREILALLYGADVARRMLEVIASEPGLGVMGYISPVALTRQSRRDIFFFINGRPVQDSALAAALTRGYHTLLMVGRFPLAVLLIEMDPETVDVNVHPTKAEVRFREPERVFSGVQNAVRRALLAHNPVPTLGDPGAAQAPFGAALRWSAPAPQSTSYPPLDYSTYTEPPSSGAPEGWTADSGPDSDPPAPIDYTQSGWQGTPTPAAPASPAAQPPLPARHTHLLRPVGQVANSYLVAEGPDGLYLIDQHAAHERVLFERFMAQRGASIPSQALLQPASVELPAPAARLVADQLDLLGRLGFTIEPFGPNTFLVRSLPALLSSLDPAAALRVLVENFEEDETPLQAEQEARIIARVCKRAAVKAGMSLSPEEQRALLNDLEACASPRTCPHGRPTMIHLPVDLLERQFGRRGAR